MAKKKSGNKGAGAAEQPQQANGKAKSKAAAKKPEPVPEPVAVVPEPTPVKKTRRGGGKKTGGGGGNLQQVAPLPDKQKKAVEKINDELKVLPGSYLQGEKLDTVKSLITQMNDLLKTHNAKRPKSNRTAAQVAQDLAEFETNPDLADWVDEKNEKKQEYKDVLAWEEFSALKKAIDPIMEKAKKRLPPVASNNTENANPNASAQDAERAEEDRKRIATRVADLAKVPLKDVDPNNMLTRSIELAPEVMTHMFYPMWIARKHEQKHGVCIEAPGGKGKGKGVPRSLNLYGATSSALDECISALRDLDFSCQKTVALQGRAMGAVIGPGGDKIKAMEKKFDVYCNTGRNEVTVYGPKDGVENALKVIDEAKEAAERLGEMDSSFYHPDKARVLLTDEGKKFVEKVQKSTDTAIRVHQPGETQCEISFKGRNKTIIGNAQSEISKYLDTIVAELLPAEENILAKVARDGKFRGLKDASAAHVSVRATGIMVAGAAKEVKRVKDLVKQMIVAAGYEPVHIPIQQEQRRVFSQERCAALGEEVGCDVMMVRGGEAGWMLRVTGAKDAQEEAQATIEKMIETEASISSFDINRLIVNPLIANYGALINSIQDQCVVSVNLDRRENKVTLVGGVDNIASAKKMIDELEAKEANVPTCDISIGQDDIRRVIGTKGANIREIREMGVDAQIDEAELVIRLRGPEAAMETAKQFIADLTGYDEMEEVEGYVPPEKPVETKKSKKKKQEDININCEAMFPTLGSASNGTSKAAGVWGGKAGGDEEADAEGDEEVEA